MDRLDWTIKDWQRHCRCHRRAIDLNRIIARAKEVAAEPEFLNFSGDFSTFLRNLYKLLDSLLVFPLLDLPILSLFDWLSKEPKFFLLPGKSVINTSVESTLEEDSKSTESPVNLLEFNLQVKESIADWVSTSSFSSSLHSSQFLCS